MRTLIFFLFLSVIVSTCLADTTPKGAEGKARKEPPSGLVTPAPSRLRKIPGLRGRGKGTPPSASDSASRKSYAYNVTLFVDSGKKGKLSIILITADSSYTIMLTPPTDSMHFDSGKSYYFFGSAPVGMEEVIAIELDWKATGSSFGALGVRWVLIDPIYVLESRSAAKKFCGPAGEKKPTPAKSGKRTKFFPVC